MKVKPGLIPDGWEAKTLGNVCGRITTGKLDANAMVADGDYPFFTCASENYWIDKYAFDCEALLVSGNGANVGYVHYYNGKFNAYQRTYVISEFSADVQFIKLFLDRNLQQRIRTEVNAGNTPYIRMGTLTEMSVVLPRSRDEQRAIAGVLSDMDALIGSLDQLIAKKRDLKQAAMQQLLTGQTRLPGFHGEWEVKTLASVLSKGRLGGNYPNQDREADYPLMKMGNIARGYMDTGKVEYITPGITPDPNHRLCYGDVLFNTRNTLDLVGKVGIWRNELPIAYYNSNLMRLEFDPQEVCSNEYANYALNSAVGVARLRALATGTTSVAAIYTRDLLGMPFNVPPLSEQTAIAKVLSDIDAELAALEQRRDKTRALKQGMMQELLMGRTRLVDMPRSYE